MMNPVKRALAFSCTIALVLACAALPAHGADPTEDDYYPIVEIPIPEDINLEVGALEWMPDGILAVATRRGDIYLVENVLAEDTSTVKFQKVRQRAPPTLRLGAKRRRPLRHTTQRNHKNRRHRWRRRSRPL